MADEAEARGNAAFSSGDFTSAIRHFTEAINLAPTNHVLFSNRSAAHASLEHYEDALSDAEKTVELKPDWAEGYSRLIDAHLGLDQFQDAVDAYNKELEIVSSNEELNLGLDYAQACDSRSSFGLEMWMGEKKIQERKKIAKTEKGLGTAAYKNKDFETAIQHYSTAMEIDDEDISYITDRAAVYLETGKYNECIEDCDKAVEKGRELRSDYKMVARALTSKGTALTKMARCSKDYEPAIEAFHKALTEHRNPETLNKLNKAERAKKEWEEKEYFDPKIGDEERVKGNDFFKEQKYPDAIKHYTEAIKRNPEDLKAYGNRAACYNKLGAMPEGLKDAIKHYTEAIKRNPKDPKAYSNRAACYTKLGAMPEGLKDAEKRIELDPTFSKGYSRKAAVEFFLKEYDTAIETCQEGLKHDPNNQELLIGVRRCVQEINRRDLTPEELKERQRKGMKDPEIHNIVTDPVMGQVLSDLQENPSAAQRHMQNPMIMNKIQRLISAGIVQMK